MTPYKQALVTLHDTLHQAQRLGFNDFTQHVRTAIRRLERQMRRWKGKAS